MCEGDDDSLDWTGLDWTGVDSTGINSSGSSTYAASLAGKTVQVHAIQHNTKVQYWPRYGVQAPLFRSGIAFARLWQPFVQCLTQVAAAASHTPAMPGPLPGL